MTEEEVKKAIDNVVAKPSGFEVYVITKADPQLKKMGFIEKGGNNLRHKLRESILQVIKERYTAEGAEYVSADRIADEQQKLYVIHTSESYDPFAVLNTAPGEFSQKDIDDLTGIVFQIRSEGGTLWAYQHLWSIMVPNKSRKNILGRLVSNNHNDVFEELSNPVITFAKRVDLLAIDDVIVTQNYKLLQTRFGFHDYIRIRADQSIAAIRERELVANVEKLTEYVRRGNGKTKYAKKMMRIADSKVLKMDPKTMWENIHRSSRWNGRIKEEDGKFVLDTYVQVENLIDLLDERYTRSEITGEEYDTEVKQVASPA